MVPFHIIHIQPITHIGILQFALLPLAATQSHILCLFRLKSAQQDDILALFNVSCVISSSASDRKREIPFTVPPRFTTQSQCEQKEAEGMRMKERRDILAHRGSLSVSSRSRPHRQCLSHSFYPGPC